jgi:mevalonate kinase
LSDEQVSELAFQVEVIHHGTPSGIDNTVVTYARPVYFVKGKAPEILQVKQTLTVVIGDTGVQSSTASVVMHIAWEKASGDYERYSIRSTGVRRCPQPHRDRRGGCPRTPDG